jgi:adenine/guanine/hypoxanthine permease
MSETDWSDNSGEAASSPPKQRWTPRLAAQAVVAGAGAAALAVAEFAEDVGDRGRRFIGKTNRWAESSRFIGRKYGFKERFTRLSVELRAGVVTFLMMSYVLAVNPQILGATGGVCDAETLCSPQAYERLGRGCLFRGGASEAAVSCLSNLVMNLTTATAASSLIACFIVGFFGNMPVALASGMGINIYVAYQIVGQEQLTYQQAMTAIFVEAWIFIILSLSGVRGAIMRYMPSCIAYAASVGIGLLLAFTGLRNLGVIVFDDNTLVALGGCTIKDRNNIFTIPQSFSSDLNVTSAWTYVEEASPNVYGCNGATLRNATLWLGVAGGVLMALLHAWRVNGSLFLGIAFVTVVSWIPGHAASYLGAESSIPGGETRMEVFKQVVAAPSLDQTGLAWDWSAIDTGQFWLAVFTFLYIDLLDCTGTLLSMAGLLDDCMKDQAEEEGRLETYKPFVSDKREFRGQQWAFLADGIGILSGSMMGVTPLTVYIESAAGIEDGGRTGVVAITVSFCFFVALFFSPILSSIPPYATGPALVLVGVLLIVHVDRIKWDDTVQAVPAFLTIIMMPFTLSGRNPHIFGFTLYLFFFFFFAFRALHFLRHRGRRNHLYSLVLQYMIVSGASCVAACFFFNHNNNNNLINK